MSVTISGSGQIIKQVQTASVTTSIAISIGSTYTWYDITGMSVSITPTNASNKILIVANINPNSALGTVGLNLVRGSTSVGQATEAGYNTQCIEAVYPSGNGPYTICPVNIQYLDSPATTSPVTYKLQANADGTGTMYFNRRSIDTRFVCTATIYAYEVAYA